MKYLFFFLILIISILLTNSYGLTVLAQAPKAPETLEEAKTVGERMLIDFPSVLRKVWQEALTIWQRMLNWFRNFWQKYISAWFESIWQKISSLLGREVEKRKPEIEEEFEKEKQEMKEEIPKVSKSLWQRFKELVK